MNYNPQNHHQLQQQQQYLYHPQPIFPHYYHPSSGQHFPYAPSLLLPAPPPVPPVNNDDLFKLQFAASQLGLLVKGAEIILSSLHPWVDPQLRIQIDEWFCRKEECVACMVSAESPNPNNQHQALQQPLGHKSAESEQDQSSERDENYILNSRKSLSSSCSGSEAAKVGDDDIQSEVGDSEFDGSGGPSEKELSDEIDSDEEIDEEESDGSNTEALVEHIEAKFKAILDEKITETEGFLDNHQFAINVAPSDISKVPKEPFDDPGFKRRTMLSDPLRKRHGVWMDSDQMGSHLCVNEDDEDRNSVASEDNQFFHKIISNSRLKSPIPLRSKSDGEIYYQPISRLPNKTVSGWDTGYGMSPVEKLDMCLTELQEIIKSSTGDGSERGDNSTNVPEVFQRSVVQLIKTVRSALKGSHSPIPVDEPKNREHRQTTHSSGNVSEQYKSSDNDITQRISESQTYCTLSDKNHIETQTDDTSFSGPIDSIQTKNESDIARSEIALLRDARSSLVNQRKEISDKIKQAGPEDSMKNEEKRLYEFEEAIEAIDTAIEYKNEIICGQKCILSNQSAPGRNEADLVTRLTSMSLLDLQRLLCKYFSKVVELRFSSRKLEKTLEKIEADREKLRRRVAMDQKFMKEMDSEHDSRIKHLLSQCNKDPHSAMDGYFRTLDKALNSAKRKQYDLERSLTELLVRHGYLLNGADYDVKQVVRMLGIDTTEMGLNWRDSGNADRRRKDKGPSGLIPHQLNSVLDSGTPGHGLRRMKDAISQRRNAQASSHHPPPLLDLVRKGHHHHSTRQPEPPSEPFPVTEVRRQKKRLIIQPPQSHQPSSSHHHHHHH